MVKGLGSVTVQVNKKYTHRKEITGNYPESTAVITVRFRALTEYLFFILLFIIKLILIKWRKRIW